MVKRKLEWKDLRRNLAFTSRTLKNLKEDNYVGLETLEKLCIYLNEFLKKSTVN